MGTELPGFELPSTMAGQCGVLQYTNCSLSYAQISCPAAWAASLFGLSKFYPLNLCVYIYIWISPPRVKAVSTILNNPIANLQSALERNKLTNVLGRLLARWLRPAGTSLAFSPASSRRSAEC